MKNKIIFLIVLMYFISSCSGFGIKRSDKADEFLIEKKAPLVMPPDIEDLPEPQGIDKKNQSDDEFREILNSNNTANTENSNSVNNSSLKENIIKKIEE